MAETLTAPATYSSVEAAARAWGAAHSVSGRTGGYLYAANADAYRALPWNLRVGRPDQRAKFALVKPNPSASGSGTLAVQGWQTLGAVLLTSGHIGIDRSDRESYRYHLTEVTR
jgi:hypothetical protein